MKDVVEKCEVGVQCSLPETAEVGRSSELTTASLATTVQAGPNGPDLTFKESMVVYDGSELADEATLIVNGDSTDIAIVHPVITDEVLQPTSPMTPRRRAKPLVEL